MHKVISSDSDLVIIKRPPSMNVKIFDFKIGEDETSAIWPIVNAASLIL